MGIEKIEGEIYDLRYNPDGERDRLSRLIGHMVYHQIDSQQMYSIRIINKRVKLENYSSNHTDTLIWHVLFCGNVPKSQRKYLKDGTRIRMQAKHQFFKNVFWADKDTIKYLGKNEDTGDEEWIPLKLMVDDKK